MKIKSIAASTALILGLVVSASAEEVSVKTSTVGANGVRVDTTRSESVEKTLMGGTKRHSETSTTEDPKGLNNSVTASNKQSTTVYPNGDFSNEKVTKRADGTVERSVESRDTSAHLLDSGHTTTTKRTSEVDPSGLNNKNVRETEEVVTRNAAGKVLSREVTERVNGEVVAQKTTK